MTVPFRTLALTVDGKTKKFGMSPYFLGYGGIIIADVAGDSDFGTIQFHVPLALHLPFNNRFDFTIGLSPSINRNSLNYSNLFFPDQYNNFGLIPDMATRETFRYTELSYFNLGAGINGIYKRNQYQTYSAGFSVNNLTQPQQSFNGQWRSVLKRRYQIHSILKFKVKENVDVLPSAKIQFQGSQKEYQFGASGFYYVDNPNIQYFNSGLWFRSRNSDAIAINIGLKYHSYAFGFTYDINVSKLHEASNGHGAFEISFQYIYNRFNYSRRIKSIKCPSYI